MACINSQRKTLSFSRKVPYFHVRVWEVLRDNFLHLTSIAHLHLVYLTISGVRGTFKMTSDSLLMMPQWCTTWNTKQLTIWNLQWHGGYYHGERVNQGVQREGIFRLQCGISMAVTIRFQWSLYGNANSTMPVRSGLVSKATDDCKSSKRIRFRFYSCLWRTRLG